MKKQSLNQVGHVVCVILTSVLRRSLLTSLPLFSGAQFRSIYYFSLLLLSPGFHTVPSHSAYSIIIIIIIIIIILFFKAGTAGYIQNDLISASLSKLKIVCYIAMSPVSIGLHFLHTRVHDRCLGDASRSVRGISWKTAFRI